jgi:nucleoside 2-deoxyribosyltransferase
MKKVYIAGPLFDDHERKYLEEISDILEKYSYDTFLPHRDAGLVKGEFTLEIKKKDL